MTPTLTAALVLAGTAVAATFFIYRFQLPRERRHAGRALFASMDWSDFTHLVLALLNARGAIRIRWCPSWRKTACPGWR